ncbi:MAG: amidohydrolase [Marinilabiliales bacterium]|nr:MAG: amidohydrolase [Marinilabiliales bacterium]
MNEEIIQLRHSLHKEPEVSNDEFKTADRISAFMMSLKPDEAVKLSKTGLAFVFDSGNPGQTSMFRAELDALPIKEINTFDYASENDAAHACGHDGHMSIIAALGQNIAANPPHKGRTILLFQPAEEVEQGARDVVNDPNFKAIEPDYIFALHNIPGVPKHQILLKNGSFAAASKGMTVKLTGKTSHAAEPENGISPADAISRIISELHVLRSQRELFSDLTLLTIIHIQLGEISFGTSPGYAEIRITLRAFENKDMELLTEKSEKIIKSIAAEEDLNCEIGYSEVFPATVNDETSVKLIEDAAKAHQLNIQYLVKPYKWSEDFAYYTEKYKGGFFGLGAGQDQPPLHNPDYNFPDDIIETGMNVFYHIYKKLHHD